MKNRTDLRYYYKLLKALFSLQFLATQKRNRGIFSNPKILRLEALPWKKRSEQSSRGVVSRSMKRKRFSRNVSSACLFCLFYVNGWILMRRGVAILPSSALGLTFCVNYNLKPSDIVSSWEVYYLNR